MEVLENGKDYQLKEFEKYKKNINSSADIVRCEDCGTQIRYNFDDIKHK